MHSYCNILYHHINRYHTPINVNLIHYRWDNYRIALRVPGGMKGTIIGIEYDFDKSNNSFTFIKAGGEFSERDSGSIDPKNFFNMYYHFDNKDMIIIFRNSINKKKKELTIKNTKIYFNDN